MSMYKQPNGRIREMICPTQSNSQFETKIMSWISNGNSHGFSQHRAARRQLQDLQPVHVSTFGAASSSLRVNVGSDGSVVTWGKGGHRVDAYHGIGHMSQKVA